MEKQNLEILVVEDNPQHLEDAKVEINKRVEAGANLGVTYATNYREADELMQSRNYDGIITDIFMPSGAKEDNLERGTLYTLLESYINQAHDGRPSIGIKDEAQKWRDGEGIAPFGAKIANDAKKQNVPVAMCTSGFHHGTKYEPVFRFSKDNAKFENGDLQIVDVYQKDLMGEADSKPWERAYDKLIKEVTKRIVNPKMQDRFFGRDDNPQFTQWTELAQSYGAGN